MELEPQMEQLRDNLKGEGQQVLYDYLQVCQGLGDCLVWIAYELGRRHERERT